MPNTDYNQYVSRKKAFVETKNFSMAGRELTKLKELRKMSDENVQPVDVGEVPTPGETIETPSVEAGGSFVDDYAVDVPDIPIPDDEPEGNSIEDEF